MISFPAYHLFLYLTWHDVISIDYNLAIVVSLVAQRLLTSYSISCTLRAARKFMRKIDDPLAAWLQVALRFTILFAVN